MSRFEDWPRRLDTFIEEASRREFSWARFNCCLLPADAVQAMTGIDPAKPFRRAIYQTSRGVASALRRYLGSAAKDQSMDAMVEAVASKLCAESGFPEIGPLYAQRGDVCLVDVSTGASRTEAALGVCLGARVAVPARDGGLMEMSLTAIRRAWRV